MKKMNIFAKFSGIALAAVAIFASTAGAASASSKSDQFAKEWRKKHWK